MQRVKQVNLTMYRQNRMWETRKTNKIEEHGKDGDDKEERL